MNAAIVQTDQLRQLYGPSVASMTSNFPAMGQSLSDACNALATDCTVTRIDELVARLQTAQNSLARLRRAMVEAHGTG